MAQDPATRRRAFLAGAAVLVLGAAGTFALVRRPFPSDRTAEGAYLRIARSVADDDPRGFFAYLEQEAQWACFTLRDVRKSAAAKIAAAYPEPERTRLLAEHAAVAAAHDGSDVFAHLYRARGWSRRLRKDLSGVARVEQEGDRASVVTVRGTRYPFRRRENGIWGLTVFTAELLTDAEKASRDLAVVEAAAADYARLKPATVIP
jgi:hypothetical protein